jgi:hypothetical protein
MAKAAAFTLTLLWLAVPAGAHPGKLDGNGCHYDSSDGSYHCHRTVKPNRVRNAAVKKSRENVCHDSSSSNYSTVKFFVAYPTMKACLDSGGRAPH